MKNFITNQTALNSNVESTLSLAKQLTNWKNNELNNIIPLWDLYENHIMRESRISLNILTAREPMGLSARVWLFLLASHRMALTKQRKNPSWIARDIENFSIFFHFVSTLVLKHNLRFQVFHSTVSTICWSWWSINIYETFGQNTIAVFLWSLVSAPCSETGPNLRTSLFVYCWLWITKLCTGKYMSILKPAERNGFQYM